jgi:adenosine/AMP kinase
MKSGNCPRTRFKIAANEATKRLISNETSQDKSIRLKVAANRSAA